MHAVPGGPFTAEKKLPPAVLTAVEARYKLNDPLWKQYTDYLGHVVQGDFGPSFKYPGRTVNNIIAETAPVSAVLGGISLIVSLIVGIVSGLAAASRKNSLLDYACLIFATLGVSVPGFIIAALLVEVFAFLVARITCSSVEGTDLCRLTGSGISGRSYGVYYEAHQSRRT